MTKTNSTPQDLKPKTCKFAIASFVVGLAASVAVFALALFLAEGAACGMMIAAAGIILGVAALVKIHKSRGSLKGRILAALGIFVCIAGQIAGLYLAGLVFFHARQVLWRDICGGNLRALATLMADYANEHGSLYPPADKWCDTLVRQANIAPRQLNCSVNKDGRCSYAINPNCEPNSPPDMVLLFETKGGWNQFGGPEILTTDNHDGKGCNVLFNDGRVRFVKTKDLRKLKWKVEEGK